MSKIKVGKLINKLDNPPATANIDMFEDLKRTILGFFKNRTEVVDNLEGFRGQLKQALAEKVEEGNLTFEELLRLYNAVSNQINNASDSIIGIFKPVPGAESFLAKTLSNQDVDDAINKFNDSLTPEEAEKIESLMKIVLSKKNNNT